MDGSLVSTGLYILGALVLGYGLFRFLPQVLDSILNRTPFNKTLGYFVSDSMGFLIILVLIVSGVLQLDENARVVAILITVGSGAFIFTSEGWIQDAFAGIGLQIYNKFKIGDWVTISGNRGKVARLGLFRTDLETLQLDLVSVRNSEVLSSNIINHSGIPFREIEIIVHTADYGEYGENIRRYLADVQQIALRVQAEICPPILEHSRLRVKTYFLEFGSSSDFVTVVYYAFDRDEAYRDAVSAMHVAMAEELRAKGVVLGQVNGNTIDNVIEYKRVE